MTIVGIRDFAFKSAVSCYYGCAKIKVVQFLLHDFYNFSTLQREANNMVELLALGAVLHRGQPIVFADHALNAF